MCHSRIRVGSANASDKALNASKNVALPITIRAFMCHRENGTCSIRVSRLAASVALRRVRSLSRPSVPTKPSTEFNGSHSQTKDEIRKDQQSHRFRSLRYIVLTY